MPFTLAPLPYSHDALEPHIDTLTMQIHHGKHHQAYVDNLNKAIAGSEHENKTLETLIASAGTISPAVRNNGGGHWNHTFFWESLGTNAGGNPTGELADAISSAFGSFDAFKEKFELAAMKLQGSNWVYLARNGEIKSIRNHETRSDIVLLIDWWEHSWVLDYQADKKKYLENQWKIINWDSIKC